MSKHTAGPIIIDERDGKFLLTADRSASDVEAVGVVYKRADADLFAAAPELLEALKVCATLINVQNGNLHQDVNAILEMARLAVSKAEGRS